MMHVKFMTKGSDDFRLFSDVRSLRTTKEKDGKKFLILRVLEPIKTSACPGYTENEVIVEISGEVYIMNENGKTIDILTP